MRILMILLAALIVAGGAGFYVLSGFGSEPVAATATAAAPAPEPKADPAVYVPARSLPIGTLITETDLARMTLAEGAISPEMVVADADGEKLLVGAVARQPLAQGVPVARSAVVHPGERGFLAAVLPRGKRAITIEISEVEGLSGLVLPGDHVDLILTYSIPADSINAGRDIRASETVMRDVRVLALDQRLGETPDPDEIQGAGGPIAHTATLEVSPREAEAVSLAKTLGSLSLALNSMRDDADAADDADPASAAITAAPGEGDPLSREITLDSQVTSLLQRQVPAPELAARVQVVRGKVATDVGLTPAAERAAPAAAQPPAAQ